VVAMWHTVQVEVGNCSSSFQTANHMTLFISHNTLLSYA
jgi:hypothetical protein